MFSVYAAVTLFHNRTKPGHTGAGPDVPSMSPVSQLVTLATDDSADSAGDSAYGDGLDPDLEWLVGYATRYLQVNIFLNFFKKGLLCLVPVYAWYSPGMLCTPPCGISRWVCCAVRCVPVGEDTCTARA